MLGVFTGQISDILLVLPVVLVMTPPASVSIRPAAQISHICIPVSKYASVCPAATAHILQAAEPRPRIPLNAINEICVMNTVQWYPQSKLDFNPLRDFHKTLFDPSHLHYGLTI